MHQKDSTLFSKTKQNKQKIQKLVVIDQRYRLLSFSDIFLDKTKIKYHTDLHYSAVLCIVNQCFNFCRQVQMHSLQFVNIALDVRKYSHLMDFAQN